MIFANAHESKDRTWYSYSTGISNKREDGSYANMYLDVRFRNGVHVNNKTKINIKDGFLTMREYMGNGGEKVKRIVLMILDFDIAESGFASAPAEPQEPSGFTALDDSEVPF